MNEAELDAELAAHETKTKAELERMEAEITGKPEAERSQAERSWLAWREDKRSKGG